MSFGELDWQFVYSMLAATGVLVAAIYHIMILRYNMRAREMEICRLHMSDILTEQSLRRYTDVLSLEWKDYEDFDKKYGLSNPEIFSKWNSILYVMETTGLLIKNKVVKPELIYALGGYGSIVTWEKYKDVIQRLRKDPTWGGQNMFRNFEFLVQEMQKIKTRNEG